MNAAANSFAAGGAIVTLLLGATGALAQDGFDDGSLKGVYAVYSTDSSQSALFGVVEFDTEGGVPAGTTTLFLLDPIAGPPVQVIPVEVDSGTYEIFPDGSGVMTTVATVPGLGELSNSWEFVITKARKKDGIAEELRVVMGELSLVGQVWTGYLKKLPAPVIPSLVDLDPDTEGFDEGSLKGVYTAYSTDSSLGTLLGLVEFDAEGLIEGFFGDVFLPDPDNPPDPDVPGDQPPLLRIPVQLISGDYAIDPDGTGSMSVTVDAPILGTFDKSWELLITEAKKDTGVADEVRIVSNELDPTGEVGTGFLRKLPIGIVPSLE